MYTKKSKQFFVFVSGLIGLSLNAQTVIYSTDFGTVANVNPAGWTFTGTNMTISTNTTSSGYTGASGGAYLGEGNSVAYINTSGGSMAANTATSGTSTATLLLSTTGYTNITLGFGMRQSSAGYTANVSFEWSTDNISYSPIVFTPSVSSWGLASGSGLVLPSGAENQANLYLRWTFVRTGATGNYKIDDFKVEGTTGPPPPPPPANIGFNINNQNVSEGVGTMSASIAISNSNSLPSSVDVVVLPYGTASIGSDITYTTQTITFPANATGTLPVNILINDDVIQERAEYFIIELQNPVNATLTGIKQQTIYILDNDFISPVGSNEIQMNFISSFSNGAAGTNSAEIIAHDPVSQRLFIANSIAAKLDIVNFSNPAAMSIIQSIDITPYGNINSVAVKNGIVACAVENSNPQADGFVVFFDTNGNFLKQVSVGAMPDMITFNHSGTKVLTANEGEPNTLYTVDPEGSVSVIDISGGIASLSQLNVTTIGFTSFNSQIAALKASGVRIFGLGATVAQDFEPEYITISDDDSKAWIALQENNAMAVLNLITNTITEIKPLGYKNHNLEGNALDASDNGSTVKIANWNVKGMYMPDAITHYTVGGNTYIITANEGDSREYTGFNELTRLNDVSYVLDPTVFPDASVLKNNANLGRVRVTNATGDTDGDGDFDEIYVYGARSFSIWNATDMTQVYDSGDDLEQITANDPVYGSIFNCSNTNITKKDRSDDKGPEPEGVAVAKIAGKQYAFVSMERVGGMVAYNIDNPSSPQFVQYVNNRGLSGLSGDRGPEGIIFIPQNESPTEKALIVLGNEVSSTTSVYEIACPAATVSITAGGTTTFCNGNNVSLSSSTLPGATYTWYNGATPITGATSSSYNATAAGSYSVQLSNVGCNINSNSISVTVNPLPNVTVSTMGATTFCQGNTVQFSVPLGNSYQWQLNGNPISGATANFYIASASGNYNVVVTNTSTSCTNTSVVKTVSVNPLPNVVANASDVDLCAGDQTVLTGSNALNYFWDNGVINGQAFTPVSTNIYTVLGIDANGCSNTASVTVTVNAYPAMPSISQSGNILTSTPASTYQWYLNGTMITGATLQDYIVTQSGVYTVVIGNTAGCEMESEPYSVIFTDIIDPSAANNMAVYPNPYNDYTTIKMELTVSSKVKIEVVNVLGEIVAVLIDKELQQGEYQFNFGAKQFGYSSGIYFIKAIIGEKINVVRIVENN